MTPPEPYPLPMAHIARKSGYKDDASYLSAGNNAGTGNTAPCLKFVAAYTDKRQENFRYVFSVPDAGTTLWVVVKFFAYAQIHTVKIWNAPACSPRDNRWRTDIAFQPSIEEISHVYQAAQDDLERAIAYCQGGRV